jgi:hypothetical protein
LNSNFIQIYFNFDEIEVKENREMEQRGLQKGTYLKDIYICKVQFHVNLFQLHQKKNPFIKIIIHSNEVGIKIRKGKEGFQRYVLWKDISYFLLKLAKNTYLLPKSF